MKLRLAALSLFFGAAFLVGSLLSFLQIGEASKVAPSLLEALTAGSTLFWLQIVWFLFAFVLLHGAAGWLFAYTIQPVADKLEKFLAVPGRRVVLLLFLIAVVWLILESAAQFRNTVTGRTLHVPATSAIGISIRYSLATIVFSSLAAGIFLHFKQLRNHLTTVSPRLLIGATGIITLLIGWAWLTPLGEQSFPIEDDKPHVIVVGIDGWRLDMLPTHGGSTGLMPFVEDFVANSARFEEALTPLARSFPAWWTVFTGQYPVRHGARFNLIAEDFINTPALLPQQMGKRGYHRIFAIDERRFANIRGEHGFDQIIGPQTGAADFLLGNLKDTPLTNLAVNTRPGRLLFPFNHGNRAAYGTYRPSTFDQMLIRGLENAPRKPLFLAVHYELPHWPYYWAKGPTGRFLPHPLGRRFAHYKETLARVDRQVSVLFETLDNLGVLDNAVVILLSDHGQAFSEEPPVWHTGQTGKPVRTAATHGTSILALQQHRVPLVFRSFDGKTIEPGIRAGRASLADVYPTLMEWLDLPAQPLTQGQSLLSALEDPEQHISEKPIPLETGFTVPALDHGPIDTAGVFRDTHAYYRITKDARLELKPDSVRTLLERKSRGVIYKHQILQASHTTDDDRQPRWIIGQMNSKTLINTTGVADADTETGDLIRAFCTLFESDPAVSDHCYPTGPRYE